MRSRLQRLAEQRRCWDGDASAEAAADCPPLSVLSRPAEAPVAPPASSEAPVGRRGRLAHLAATIGSWEDDLSHANIPKESPKVEQQTSRWRVPAKEKTPASSSSLLKTPASFPPPPSSTLTSASSSSPLKTPASFPPPPSSTLTSASSSSPLKTPASFPPPPSSTLTPASSSSPLKTPASFPPPPSSTLTPASSSSPLKTPASFPPPPSSTLTSASSSSPMKSKTPSTGPYTSCSPHKAEVRPQAPHQEKPHQEKPHQEKPPSGAPAVKSFLERFEERCQERALHPPPQARTPAGGPAQARTPAGGPAQARTPAGGPAQARTPAGGPAQSRTPAGTPNTKLVQDRLRAAQNANTSTADLTQRQKLERESELALIRNRFQKGNNVWRNNDQQLQSKASSDQQLGPSESSSTAQEPSEEPAESEEKTSESQEEPETQTPSKTTAGPALTSPPVSTSSPLRSTEDEGQVASRDQTINSAVISQLFEGVLDQTEEEEEEEEDALNISSMSLLTPLAAVVKSPERGMMTSTPANSFLLKNTTPDRMTRPGRTHKPVVVDSSSSDSLETGEDEPRLPYSIDAYRSTRVKETERPGIKQVIVRKEDVSQRAGEPRGAGLLNIKQKMKVLTGEMNLQQTVIHQASQALNCCTDEEHGKGSQVEAEAERLLLVATERREALKYELERLRGRPAAPPDPPATSASRGSISLQELRLPLKADFVCSTAGRSESKHSFFILIRAGAEHTVATPLASTHRGLSGDTLTFNTTFTL
uniref:Anillin, actin binding protein n=1 Tax=Salarias fasciatus TaxID=181472 RepID=A0A672FLW4_SALFA